MKKIFSNGSSSFDNQSVIKNKIYSYGSGEVLNSVRHSILPPKCLQLSIVVYFCNTRNLFISTVEYVQFLNSEQFRCPKKRLYSHTQYCGMATYLRRYPSEKK